MKKEIEKEKPSSYAEGAISVLTVLKSGSRNIESVWLEDMSKIKPTEKLP